MHNKHQVTEEPCNGKLLSTVLETSGFREKLAEFNTLSERLQQRENAPRTRKPLEQFVFSGRWNQVSPLVTSQD